MKNMENKKFYITTAIAYTSRKPHIGNTYEAILTDAIARFKRKQGYDVFFLTGTDEHGQKIEELAKEAGVAPQTYVDGVAGEIRAIWDKMNVSYDKFIRTTDNYHEEAVKKIFTKLYNQGDIYKSEYEGMYCVPCESFFTETQLVDGCCPDCGRSVKKTKEEAYFFKMSKYADRLMKHIEENPEFIQPESRKKEMVNNFLKPGLQDLCVSRSTFKWGVPVEFDSKHVIYVWIDALSNYITALGYSPDNEEADLYKKYWPADVHIIGKDILRFHTIYWPIILMALGQPLPKQVFGHPWLLFGNDKMSKSKGNVIYADELADKFGVDAVRYYVLSEMPFANDGSITYEMVINKYNGDLANILGNLVTRTVSMINKYFDGMLQPGDKNEPVDEELKQFAVNTYEDVCKAMKTHRVADSLEAIMNLARRSNKYIDETMPWALAKNEEDKPRLATVMYNLYEAIRFIATMLSAFMPETAEKILQMINSDLNSFSSLETFGNAKSGVKVGEAAPLFARIDAEKMLAEITKPEEEVPALNLKPEITIDDVAKLDLRVAIVTAAEKVEKADKLLKLTLEMGGEIRTIVSGIAKHYTPEEMVGKQIIVVANLKPAKIRGVESYGMLLAAADEENLVLLTTDGNIPTGTQVG